MKAFVLPVVWVDGITGLAKVNVACWIRRIASWRLCSNWGAVSAL